MNSDERPFQVPLFCSNLPSTPAHSDKTFLEIVIPSAKWFTGMYHPWNFSCYRLSWQLNALQNVWLQFNNHLQLLSGRIFHSEIPQRSLWAQFYANIWLPQKLSELLIVQQSSFGMGGWRDDFRISRRFQWQAFEGRRNFGKVNILYYIEWELDRGGGEEWTKRKFTLEGPCVRGQNIHNAGEFIVKR